MPLPINVDEVTAPWFSKILKDVHIKPETFKMVPNAQDGTGFLSMIARVEFETEPAENDKNFRKKYNLIVKLIPDAESFLPEARDCILEGKYDMVEINTYQQIFPELIREVPGLKKYVCEVYFAGIQEEDKLNKTPYTSVLVLEDLKPLGYFTKVFNETFSPDEFAQGIDFLASFHVASKCLELKEKKTIPEIYPWFKNWMVIENGKVPSFFQHCPTGFESIYEFLAEQSKPALIPIYKKLDLQISKILEVILLAGLEYPCAAHIDLWSHNILVSRDGSKPIQVIDWQLLAYTDPMMDLAVYILTTLPLGSLNPAGISKALRAYYVRYTELCREKNIPEERNFEEIEKFFNTYGLGFVVIWYAMSSRPIRNVPGSEAKFLRVLELLVELGTPEFLLSVI